MARFVASTPRQNADDGSENAIIDVPEEPPVPDDEMHAVLQPRHVFEPEAQPGTASEPWSQPEPAAHRYAAPDAMWLPPQHQQAPEPWPVEGGSRHGRPAGNDWQPAPAEGPWSPPGGPGSNWPSANGASPAPEPMPAQAVPEEPRRGRHSNPLEPSGAPNAQAPDPNEYSDVVTQPTLSPPPPPPPGVEPTAQHGEGQGQSVAELLTRLQAGAGPTGGGRRRRRDG
jgi:hypothetical protein